MPSQIHPPILLQAQLQCLRDDFDRLTAVLESPKLPEVYSGVLIGRFRVTMNPLRHELAAVEASLQKDEYAEAWARLSDLRHRSQHLLEEALEFLGGVTIRGTALDEGMAERAQRLADGYAIQTGIDWSPSVIMGQRSTEDWPEEVACEKNPGDSLIRLPLPRWDLWSLPLMAHDYGYWIAKRGQVKSFDQYVDEQITLVRQLLDDAPPSDAQVAPLLPEIVYIWQARAHAADLAQFRQQYRPALERLAKRQQIHLWHLIADVFATYFVGPAYPYALLFLTLDPTRPFLEGEKATATGDGRSRYLPADARRAAIVLQTLQEMDRRAKADQYADGPYTAELRLLRATWEHALEIANNVDQYRRVQDLVKPWGERIYDGLEHHFGFLAQQTADLWQKSQQELLPVLRNGANAPLQPDTQLLINAAWWCRPRFPDHIALLSRDCERLLAGGHPPSGLNAQPPHVQEEASRLLHSRLYDLGTDLERLTDLFRSKEIDQSDRDAVKGRFYRLLSEQDYGLKKLQKFISQGNPLPSSLSQVITQSQGGDMWALQQEVLDFLGGVLIRKEGLDQGVCELADALLRDYAAWTGVNWTARAIPGKNPLFSPASDMIHLRFPDWEIWDLPLMAHEFGHVTAFATPAFLTLLHEKLDTITQGHPEAATWDEDQGKAYIEKRERHIHEFFADAFAVYCQGPAFAYNVILLHLDPREAYLPRGFHPTCAERVEVILKVLEEMNTQEKRDNYESGPYASVIERLRDWWSQALASGGATPDNIYPFHKLQAKDLAGKIYNLLAKYYRLGAQYQAGDWKRADETAQRLLASDSDLTAESLRNLLNIAWACRVRYLDRQMDIAKLIRKAYEQRMR